MRAVNYKTVNCKGSDADVDGGSTIIPSNVLKFVHKNVYFN